MPIKPIFVPFSLTKHRKRKREYPYWTTTFRRKKSKGFQLSLSHPYLQITIQKCQFLGLLITKTLKDHFFITKEEKGHKRTLKLTNKNVDGEKLRTWVVERRKEIKREEERGRESEHVGLSFKLKNTRIMNGIRQLAWKWMLAKEAFFSWQKGIFLFLCRDPLPMTPNK